MPENFREDLAEFGAPVRCLIGELQYVLRFNVVEKRVAVSVRTDTSPHEGNTGRTLHLCPGAPLLHTPSAP